MDNLIARLEAAREGSRELDCAIFVFFSGGTEISAEEMKLHDMAFPGHVPHYTTSLDAALTLAQSLGEKSWLTIRIPLGGAPVGDFPGNTLGDELQGQSGAFIDMGRAPYCAGKWAATPALALVIAALKARGIK